MKDVTRAELTEGVFEISNSVYEALAPQLAQRLRETNERTDLTDGEKSDEILVDMMAYMKNCTNHILVEVLADLFEIKK